MFNFLSPILKSKKITILIFLFLLVIIIIPVPTYAASYVTDIFYGFVVSIGDFFVSVAAGCSQIASSTFESILSFLLKKPITQDKTFISGWVAVRDLANMLIVLGFVVVGISFTLRFESYGSKKVLISLIIIALLINFSGVFCGLIIDASNIAIDSLFKNNTGLSSDVSSPGHLIHIMIYSKALKYINNARQSILAGTVEKIDWTNFFLVMGTYTLMLSLVAIIFGYLCFVFLERFVRLGLLFIISPLAFVAYIFPKTRPYFDMWLQELIKWSFIGVGGCFFLWLADKMMVPYDGRSERFIPGDPISQGYNIYNLVIILMVLFAGFKITKKNSGTLAGAGIGAIKSMATFGMGAVTGGASLAGTGGIAALNKLTGGRVSAVKEKISAGTGRAMESLGLRQRGTTDTAVNKQVEEKAKLTSAAYAAAKSRNDQFTINKIRQDAKTKRGSDGAAAMQAITDAKDLQEVFKDPSGKFDALSANSRLTYAESAGAKDLRKDALKLNPELAKFNRPSDEAINKILTEHTPQGGTTIRDAEGIAAAKKIFSADEVSGAYKKATVADIRNYSKEVLSSKEFFENVKASKIGKAAQEMSSEGVDAIRSHIDHAQAEAKKCYLPGSKTVDPAKSARYNELQEKLKELSTM